VPVGVSEHRVGGISWIVVRGERDEAFRALGRHAAERIRRVVEQAPELPRLRAYTSTVEGGRRLDGVTEASRAEYPAVWRELEAMADGAGADLRDLILLSVRGDLGVLPAQECSDLGWSDGARGILGHNEDSDVYLHPLNGLLTLLIEDEPAVTVWWYPGFIPSNTWAVNEYGLAWGVDAINVADPPVAPGRSYVARGLQRVQTLDDAFAYLHSHPCAGGWSYMFGRAGESRILSVEHAAGRLARLEARPPGRPFLWHTNHLCYLPAQLNAPQPHSLARADLLSRAAVPEEPTVEWVLETMAGTALPEGIRFPGLPYADAVTLCTMVTDLAAEAVTFLPHTGRAVTIPIAGLVRGGAGAHDEQAEAVR
jgi:acyl-CoA:6-aminopenicillanic acid acyl transferase